MATKAMWYERDAEPDPPVFRPGETACPCCGYRQEFDSDSYWDGNVQGERWAVCEITACKRCDYSPDNWDGSEADWHKQADEYREGYLQELSDTLLRRCNEFLAEVLVSSGRATTGSDGEIVNAAIDRVFEMVSEQVFGLCCQLDTLEGCREVAAEYLGSVELGKVWLEARARAEAIEVEGKHLQVR